MNGTQDKILSEKKEGQIGDIDDYELYLKSLDKIWKECYRVLQPNGKLCINTPLMPIPKKQMNTHHTRNIFDINSGIQWHILHNTKFYLYDVFIWNRSNPQKRLMFGSYPYPPNFYAQNTIEFITIYVKDGKPPKRPKEIKEKSKLSEDEWTEFTKQVWELPIPGKNDPAYGEHPAIMPEIIASRLIRLFSFFDDIVLDPFLGSGTTARAARMNNRSYIGYEIMESYRPVIKKKLSQLTLGI